jgi:hypothetical protein
MMSAKLKSGTYRIFHCVSHVFLYCLHSDRFLDSFLRLIVSLQHQSTTLNAPQHRMGRHLEIAAHQISTQPDGDY